MLFNKINIILKDINAFKRRKDNKIMRHEVEKPGELLSYVNMDKKEVSYNLPYGENLIHDINCPFCGRQALVKRDFLKDCICHCCNTQYQGINQEELSQGLIEKIEKINAEEEILVKRRQAIKENLQIAKKHIVVMHSLASARSSQKKDL